MEIALSYVRTGEGFPLVLLHGNGEDHTYFKHQMGPFSERYDVIAVDTRGHGASPRGSAPFTLEQYAEDLKVLLDRLELRRCHLLGFSDGGNTALLFALKYPEYVEKLILNGANLSPAGVKLSIQLPIALGWGLLQVIRRADRRAQPKWELLDLMTTQPRIRPEELGRLAMPVLVAAGKRDMIRESHTRLIARSIPGARLALLPGDHFTARRNWPDFNRAVLEFLEEA